MKKVLDYLNIVFAVVFTLEFLLKTIGLGFVTYFKNAWNCLDVVIVAVSRKIWNELKWNQKASKQHSGSRF